MKCLRILGLTVTMLMVPGIVQANSRVSRAWNEVTAGGKTTLAAGTAAGAALFGLIHRSNILGLRTHFTDPMLGLVSRWWGNVKKGDTATLVGTGAVVAAAAGALWYFNSSSASSAPKNAQTDALTEALRKNIFATKIKATIAHIDAEGDALNAKIDETKRALAALKRQPQQDEEAIAKAKDAVAAADAAFKEFTGEEKTKARDAVKADLAAYDRELTANKAATDAVIFNAVKAAAAGSKAREDAAAAKKK